MRWTAVVRPALDGQRPVSSYPFLRFGNWGQNHAHYYPRLCDCFHGPHNDRWGGVGPFPFGRNNGSASVEILRNGNRNDIWRPCHGWPCAGLAPASRDTIKVHEQRKVTVKKKGKMKTVTKSFTKLVDENFTWKDPKAAEKAGMPVMDYVIGGMDRSFKLKLFYTLHAAEQAGLSPGITSAFRDDYRQ